ncbi:MAG: 1-acyl-sn-glycerol-3-phosphate acyltransferase [Actinomycetia bacterium]|nr:1-acyl-sn-glycerol-3-phosphate acyltransferase [Actinomycetes bacterium]
MGNRHWRPGSDLVWRVAVPVVVLWRRLRHEVAVTGLERLPEKGPVLVVANHVSFRDPLVVVTVAWQRGRRLRALVVEEAFRYPVTGWVLRWSGMIPVPPHSGRQQSLAAAAEALGAGEAVLIYPEGTIPRPGQVPRALPGVGHLALATGAPVVPVATRGLERRRARRTSDRRRCPLRRRPVTVTVGAPVPLDDLRERYAGPAPDRPVAARAAAERSLAAVRALAAS